MGKDFQISEKIKNYIENLSKELHPVQKEIISYNESLGEIKKMQIAVTQCQFLELITKISKAKKILEIGTFTGYSTLAVALALPEDGTIIACDISETWTAIGKKKWEQAGVANKIDLRLGPAIETLDELIAKGEEASFDFAFIDADKANYLDYYKKCLRLVRKGGVIAIDNVLWSGAVINSEINDNDTNAIKELNDFLAQDDRVSLSMVPIGDGLTLAFLL